MVAVPEVPLVSSTKAMPAVGLGTASYLAGEDATRSAILDALRAGYRHFDTAAIYGSEKPLGEAVREALRLGLIKSREELFITSKLWCNSADRGLVVPAIKKSLEILGLEYLDLYLIHLPMKLTQEEVKFPIPAECVLAIDIESVWEDMEACQNLGLTKAIGVSNFSSKRLREILSFAKIPPAVNQVEMNPIWQQKELREFCKENSIVLTAYSPLGGVDNPFGNNGVDNPFGNNGVMQCNTLADIAKSNGKSTAQVSLRWLYQQGVTFIVRSFNQKRMAENLRIFDWSLSEEEMEKISQIPQKKALRISPIVAGHSDIVAAIDAEI